MIHSDSNTIQLLL